MSPCAIILIVFGAGILMTGAALIVTFAGVDSIWNIHKMCQYARSIGGTLYLKSSTYSGYTKYYVVKMPDGSMKSIPESVSSNVTVHSYW